jgi:pyruvate dehydrogenase E2 component (dihydrolipoamide acetyltransferase)
MATVVTMPRQGQSVEACIITKWFKKKGEQVTAGEIIFSYETDKAAFDMEAPVSGTVLEIFSGEGEEVPVLANVAVIGTEGEETSSFRPSAAGKAVENSGLPEQQQVKASVKSVSSAGMAEGHLRISPRARRMAESAGIDVNELRGSGPNGRIVASDIPAAGSKISSSSQAGYSDVPLSNIRKLISSAMYSSLRDSAQLTHHMSADARRLLASRKAIKEAVASTKKTADITLNDMICMCVIRALKKHPAINSHFLKDTLRTFNNVNLGIAVDTPRGLMVPAIAMADKMDITGLSAALASAAEKCRKGNADPEMLRSTAASFTVSNLGNYGVEMFTPVINLPQTAILGVCTITYRPADTGDGTIGFVPVIGLSLTYDHRAIDGGPATLFLREVKNEIESFDLNR